MTNLTTVDLNGIAREIRNAFEAYAQAKYQYDRKVQQLIKLDVPINKYGVITLYEQPVELSPGITTSLQGSEKNAPSEIGNAISKALNS